MTLLHLLPISPQPGRCIAGSSCFRVLDDPPRGHLLPASVDGGYSAFEPQPTAPGTPVERDGAARVTNISRDGGTSRLSTAAASAAAAAAAAAATAAVTPRAAVRGARRGAGDGVDKPPMSSSAAPAAKVKPEASPPVVSDSRKVLRALQANHGYALQTSFISSIHAIDRISREEEVLLSRAIQQSLQLNAAAPGESSSSASPARSPTFENVAAELDMDDLEVRAIFKAGLRARATLVTANLRLVQSAVNKAMRSERNSQVSRADLMQEGILGLIRAAEKFDSTKGFAFSTYATIWIRSTITHSLKRDAAIIRVPQQAVHMKRRVERARAEYKLAHGDLAEPTVEEIAMALGVTEKEVLYVLRRPVLMSSSAFVLEQRTWCHLLADKDEDSGGICVVERAQVAATLDELRRVLSPTEWKPWCSLRLLPEHKGRI